MQAKVLMAGAASLTLVGAAMADTVPAISTVAQVAPPPATAGAPATAPAPLTAPAPPPAPAITEIEVPEGTEMPVRLEDALSSQTANTGDRFTVTLAEDVPLGHGVILHRGYKGIGEVIMAEKNGMMGKTGKLNISVSYLRVGDQRIRLRASKAAQGDHRTGTQVVTFVFVGVFAGLIKGKNIQIPRGTMITAFTDQDVKLPAPIAAPPPEI